MAQLRGELDAIADALEAVARPELERVMERVAEPPAQEAAPSPVERTRERD